MKLCVLLHFYQPHNQQEDILQRIVHESYLPLTRGFLKNKRAKAVVNINGALTELLMEKGYEEVIKNLDELHKRGQVEFTGSAKFHGFLPLLPVEESKRQVLLNTDTNKKYFSKFEPKGFFTPEMAVNDTVLEVAKDLGYVWMGVPQFAYPGTEQPVPDKVYTDKITGTTLMFRNKRVSSLILSGVCHDADDLIKETTDLHDTDKYWFAVMDAETFGHHRIGHEKFLFEVLGHEFFDPVKVSDLLDEMKDIPEELNVRPSTWTNEEQDFWLDKEMTQSTEAKSFILWKDPQNPIHKLQWELLNYAIKEVTNYPDKNAENYYLARDMLDKAEASDPFWWASAKPWWSLEMIEQGAHQLKMVLITLNSSPQSVTKSEELYRKILDQAFEWQRTGYIRKKHLDNSDTYMKKPFKKRTPKEWYNQIILEFEDEMNKSAKNRDFEKAIKWRDALLKIEQETDMYDVLHVVNELWSARNIPQVKPFLDHDWEEFSDFIKDRFDGADTKEEFEKWKKSKKLEQKTD